MNMEMEVFGFGVEVSKSIVGRHLETRSQKLRLIKCSSCWK